MAHQLREYQQNDIAALSQEFAKGVRRLLYQLSTGGGKTVVFSTIAQRFVEKSKAAGKRPKVLILVHRIELLKSTRKTLMQWYGMYSQAITPKTKQIDLSCDVYVGMVDTVAGRCKRHPSYLDFINFVIVDECHVNSFRKTYSIFPEDKVIRLGVSATPLSANKKTPMKGDYDAIVCASKDIPALISDGDLLQNITYGPEKPAVDRTKLKKGAEDYNSKQMSSLFSTGRNVQNCVDAYEKYAKGDKAIVFNCDVSHSKLVTNAFIAAGYDAKHLDGNEDEKERERILDWFAKTPGSILCNVGIATIGFDEPSIECVIVNLCTSSLPKWIQMCGRGARLYGLLRFFKIIDMGGNAWVHGDWHQSRAWKEIFDNPKKAKEDAVAPMKQCPSCEALVYASAVKCGYCGASFPDKPQRIDALRREFVQITQDIDVASLLATEAHRDHQYASLWKIGTEIAARFSEVKETLVIDPQEFAVCAGMYEEKGREWIKLQTGKPLRWSQWWSDLVREKMQLFLEKKGFTFVAQQTPE